MMQDPRMTSIGDFLTVAILLETRAAGGTIRPTDLRGTVVNAQTLRERIRGLEGDGLVTVEYVYRPRREICITLTDLGREVSGMLSVIDSMVAPDVQTKNKSICYRYVELILRMMYLDGRVAYKDLIPLIRNWNTLNNAVNMILRDGLCVKGEEEEEGYHVKYIEPTDLGRSVGRAFQEIYRIMMESREKR